MKMVLVCVAALLAATPVIAQVAPLPAATAVAKPTPEALSEARGVAARLIPPGTYKRVMASTMDAIGSNMGGMMKAIPLKQIAEIGGLDPKDAKSLDKVDLEQVMAIYDPLWQQRQQRTMQAMFAAMGDFFTTMEPDLREAMARAYTHRFTLDELRDLNRYFASPTGAKFAAQQMTMMTDPAIADVNKEMMPKMLAQMPHFLEAAQKATADMPPPRKMKELSPADRARLAKALGIDASKLEDPTTKP